MTAIWDLANERVVVVARRCLSDVGRASPPLVKWLSTRPSLFYQFKRHLRYSFPFCMAHIIYGSDCVCHGKSMVWAYALNSRKILPRRINSRCIPLNKNMLCASREIIFTFHRYSYPSERGSCWIKDHGNGTGAFALAQMPTIELRWVHGCCGKGNFNRRWWSG